MKNTSSNARFGETLRPPYLEHESVKTDIRASQCSLDLQRDPDGTKLEIDFDERSIQANECHISRVLSDLSSIGSDESSLYTLDDDGGLRVPAATKLKKTVCLQRGLSESCPHRENGREKSIRRTKSDVKDSRKSKVPTKRKEKTILSPENAEIKRRAEESDFSAGDLECGLRVPVLHDKQENIIEQSSVCSNDCVIIKAEEFEVDIAMDDLFREQERKSSKNSVPNGNQIKKKRGTSKEQHFRWFAHGKTWTLVTVLAAWAGSGLSIMSRQSLTFVTVKAPVFVAPMYKPISAIGMNQVQICYNETVALKTGCEIVHLYTSDVDDNIFELSRLFLNSGILFGAFFTLMLSTAVVWESINLRPIGLGMLSSYFLQSLTMVFFDSKLCGEHKCNLDTGCIFCITASIAWLVACVGTAKMDAFKLRAQRYRDKLLRQKAKLLITRQKELQRKITATRSDSCYSTSTSDSSTPSEEPSSTKDAGKRKQLATESESNSKKIRALSIMSCASTKITDPAEKLFSRSKHCAELDDNEQDRDGGGLHEC